MKKTTAFIEYMEDSSAQQAIDSLKDRCLHGMDKPLVVQYAIDRKKKVFVGNLPLDVSESSVSEFFSSYGKLLGVSLIEGKSNSKKCGFVFFEDEKDARNCIKEANGKAKFPGSENYLLVKRAENETEKRERNKVMQGINEEDVDERCVFIYNMPKDFYDSELDALFSTYGRIQSCKVLEGFKGFVNYMSTLSALKAVRYLDGKRIKGKRISVILKKDKVGKRKASQKY
jgi:RNA recognition motif-containing protein